MKRFLYLILLMLSFAGASIAQSSQPDPSLIPQSFSAGPNAAALSRFTDYHIDYSTGVPDIGIPIYTISAGEINIPISLKYHAAGQRVTEVPGYAGLGWTIEYGGKIARSIMGAAADESAIGYLRNPLRTNINPSNDDDLLYIGRVYYKETDTEPDIFSYSTHNKSGKFFLNRLRSFAPSLIPWKPIVIDKNFDPLTGKLWFQITSETGVKSVFGDNYREVTSANNSGVAGSNTTSWMIEKVLSARDTVTYSYTSQASIPLEDVNEFWGIDDNRNVVSPGIASQSPYVTAYLNTPAAFLTSSVYSSSTTEYLPSEIVYANGKLVFGLSTSGRKDFGGSWNAKSLKSIQVYYQNPVSGGYTLQQTVLLFHSYFMQGADTMTRRLRLDSVQIVDGNNVVLQRYRFDYNAQSLPRRNSKARDLWGYFNNKNNNTLIPRLTVPYTTGTMGTGTTITIGSDIVNGRAPDTVMSQACNLKRVYLPTGGYNDYEYEQNRYLENDSMIFAGGLRVKSIKGTDLIGNTSLTRWYRYGENENGSGKKNFTLQDYHFITTQTYRYWHNFTGGPGVVLTKVRRTISAVPNIDIVPWDAAHVIYGKVVEYRDSLGLAGKTMLTYSDQVDATLTASLAKPVKNSYFYKRGQLLRKEIFKRVGVQYLPVTSEQFVYQEFGDTLTNYAGLVSTRTTLNEGAISGGTILESSAVYPDDVTSFRYAYYAINSGDDLCTRIEKRDYDDNDPSRYRSSITEYKYGNIKHLHVTALKEQTSIGDSLIKSFKYPHDYLNGNNTGNSVLDTMIARNIQALPIETTQYLIKKGTSNRNYIAAELMLYKSQNGGRDILPDVKKELAIDAPINDFAESAVNSGSITFDSRYKNVKSFLSYANTGKLSQYQTKTMAPAVYLFDYNDEYLVAVIRNAAMSEVAYSSFETSKKGNFNFTGTSSIDLTAPTGQKVYDLGQVSGSIVFPPLLSTKTYIISYWTKNNIPFDIPGTINGYPLKGKSYKGWTFYQHKITGLTSLNFSGSGLIDELRLYPVTARMSTCCYLPKIGVISAADEADNLKFYDYDAAGRLKIEREFENIIKTIDYEYKR